MNNTIIIQTPNSFLSKTTFADEGLLSRCIDDVKNNLLVNPPIQIYGKTVYQHRSIGFFSNTSIGYRYSGQIAKSQPLSSNLENLLNQVNQLYGANFNGILINRYNNGKDYIGAHSDDESNLDAIGVVAISVGQTRTFRIRTKNDKKIHTDIEMNNLDVIHMGGDFQKEFTHEIPISKKINGVRYFFTFRMHKE